jgi:ABC-type polysaccharide/polyol phosphate export permease
MSAATAYIRDLWGRREFTAYLAYAHIRTQNASTVFGLLWFVLNPLLLAGIYYLLFGVIFGAADRVPNYIPYLLSGLFAFYFTRGALLGAANTILSNAKLMVNLRFPRLVLPLAGLVEAAFGFVASLVVYFVFAAAYGVLPGVRVLWLPVVLVVHTLFNLGIGTLAARLAVPFRDVKNLLPYLVRLWLYASPIVYAMEQVPDRLATVIGLNPMTPLLGLYRGTLLGHDLPWTVWAQALAWTAGLLVVGLWSYIRAEHRFVRYL